MSLLAGRNGALFTALLLIVVAAFVLAVASGSADISLAEAIRALRGTAPEKVMSLVNDLRLPRALTAFAVGGLLAVAGHESVDFVMAAIVGAAGLLPSLEAARKGKRRLCRGAD